MFSMKFLKQTPKIGVLFMKESNILRKTYRNPVITFSACLINKQNSDNDLRRNVRFVFVPGCLNFSSEI